jgi:hypothetical protein
MACVLALSGLAQGHNLWITGQGKTVRIVFEHSPQPGKGNYNAEILRNGKTWVRTVDHKEATPVTIEETGQPGSLWLAGSTEATGPRVIEHSCVFGIYRGRLDYFYGKFLDVGQSEQVESLGRATRLPLDIVPALKGDALELRVLWEGRLLTDYRFGVMTPSGEEISLRTNDEGIIEFEPIQPGIYGFWAIRLEDETKGVYDGEDYMGTMHGSTLSLRWPLGKNGR